MIIVTGIPGSGKTTLANWLRRDVGLRMIGQDAVKEFMADQLGGAFDKQSSSALGRVTRQAVLTLGAEFAQLGEHILVEAALQTTSAEQTLRQLDHGPLLQIYVDCDLTEVKRRFVERRASGKRHPVHTDDLFDTLTDDEIREKYRPLEGSDLTTIRFDATDIDKAAEAYRQLLAAVSTWLHASGQKTEEDKV